MTRPLSVVRDIVGDEYAFLQSHARARTKFTIPAPSWHRIFWHPEYSRAAYPTPEDFLRAIAAYLRTHVVDRIVALGGDYVQMDAPNYAQWHVDPDEVFAGIGGITRAMHVCRGNAPGGRWLANGGYERIAGEVFPRLTNYSRLLLEFDTPRAGGFEPLKHVRADTEVVLGLLTTKQATLEEADAVERRVREAAKTVGLERLAISPQCGFASGEAGNPLTQSEQSSKLRRVTEVAQSIWPKP